MRLDRFTSFVYWWFIRDLDHQTRAKFDMRLWMPPRGVAADPRSPWSPEKERSAFAALKAGTTGNASSAVPSP